MNGTLVRSKTQAIDQARILCGLTRNELAQKAGVSVPALRRLLTGIPVSMRVLRRVSEAVGLSYRSVVEVSQDAGMDVSEGFAA